MATKVTIENNLIQEIGEERTLKSGITIPGQVICSFGVSTKTDPTGHSPAYLAEIAEVMDEVEEAGVIDVFNELKEYYAPTSAKIVRVSRPVLDAILKGLKAQVKK